MAPIDAPPGNEEARRRAVRSALDDAGLAEYGPGIEANAVALSARRAARACIAAERDTFAIDTPVHFAFGATMAFNAFAHRTSADVIFVNIGTVVALWNAVNYLLADPAFLPFIKGGGEKPPPPPPAGMSFLEFCTTRPTRPPIQDARDGLAKHLFAGTQLFVVTHALTHLFGGHVGVLHENHPGRPYAEVHGKAGARAEAPLAHAMEYEADIFGCIRGLIHARESGIFAPFDPYLRMAPMVFPFIAAYLFFRLLDQRYALDGLEIGNHPLAPIRQRYLAAAIPRYAGRLGLAALSGAEWAGLQSLAVREVEAAFGRFADPGFSSAGTGAGTASLPAALEDLAERAQGLGRGTFRELFLP